MEIAETGPETEGGAVHSPQRLKRRHVISIPRPGAEIRRSARPPVAWQPPRPLGAPADARKGRSQHLGEVPQRLMQITVNGAGPRK